jgi:hypothetical protein
VTTEDGIEAAPQPRKKKPVRRKRWKIRLTRDLTIFLVGLGGIVHEAFFTHEDRPTLLILFAAMIGLPAFLRLDEKRSDEE